MSDPTTPPRLTKRTVLKALGAGTVAGSFAAPASAQSESGRPTVSVSSPDCEELEISYPSENGPPVRVTVAGATSFTDELAPGESITETVEPGQYRVAAMPRRPAQDQGQGQAQGPTNAVLVEGSPAVVTACDRTAVVIEPFCSTFSGGSQNLYNATNTTDHTVVLGTQGYSGDELVVEFTGAGMALPAGATGLGSLEPGRFEEIYGKPLTKLEFRAIHGTTREPVSVSLSEINYPDDLPCGSETESTE